MTIKRPVQAQLALWVDDLVIEPEQGVTPDEAALRLETARGAFESRTTQPDWHAEYAELLAGGWPWRVAVYMAWAASPKLSRWPKTLDLLATDVLGLTGPRSIHTWRAKNPAIDETVTIVQAAPLFKHRADVIEALVASASMPDYKNAPDRRTFFNLTGDLDEQSVVVKRAPNDYAAMTDEELAALAGRLRGQEAGA